ncbi:SIGNAL PEPTIDASE COMPLEX CATALYTIC SUBUNIT SEC11 [Salix koriyanagi]|uniref:signal peptidase I n=1 Tax=Salix koriyanagi TaxID=2511006 RepID=A0A9Q0VCV2_9ROSI|nr:SIGNAL PEPTIDASE COMPLEX CATALYTIC SUBUNIT SEC11 [Salix koriyanagi]
MEWIANSVESIKSMNIRDTLTQFITLGTIASTVLIIWKVLMCLTGSESPVVVVLSGSMEPGFRRGDILLLHRSRAPFRTGDIVVYNVENMLGTLHRVVESVRLTTWLRTENVHEEGNKGNADILTKGDANLLDDRSFYANGQHWLKPQQIIGRAVAFVPYVGWATIIMTEKPIIKYMLMGVLGLLVITSKG